MISVGLDCGAIMKCLRRRSDSVDQEFRGVYANGTKHIVLSKCVWFQDIDGPPKMRTFGGTI